ENRPAAGHRRAHQRNAQGERGRRGADRVRPQGQGQLTMRLTASFLVAGVAAAATAAAQPPEPRIVSPEVVREVRRSTCAHAYQGRERGPEQTERFSRKVKIGRDGRVSVGNISGDITVTAAGSGDEMSIEAVKRTRGDQRALGEVRIVVDERPGRVDV